ncbi:MAG TPA: hypothetical protein PKC13_30385 [Blastocatellia bacterium]|nr:hypothetical protein [Blastocatellia bacterium]HMX29933.1 hypothetical protein [Blastocatellia bacterium]HMY75985.1 hypothetical protein [Blastocatellia bacterium]HNG34836.1 hypothetical protein [Blastocatellia bacterium]
MGKEMGSACDEMGGIKIVATAGRSKSRRLKIKVGALPKAMAMAIWPNKSLYRSRRPGFQVSKIEGAAAR